VVAVRLNAPPTAKLRLFELVKLPVTERTGAVAVVEFEFTYSPPLEVKELLEAKAAVPVELITALVVADSGIFTTTGLF